MADLPQLVLLFVDEPEHYVNNSSSGSSWAGCTLYLTSLVRKSM